MISAINTLCMANGAIGIQVLNLRILSQNIMIRFEFELDWFCIAVYCECDIETGMRVYSMRRSVYYDIFEFGYMLDRWRGLRASCNINCIRNRKIEGWRKGFLELTVTAL